MSTLAQLEARVSARLVDATNAVFSLAKARPSQSDLFYRRGFLTATCRRWQCRRSISADRKRRASDGRHQCRNLRRRQ